MQTDPMDTGTWLEVARAQELDRRHPLQFHRIRALHRRALSCRDSTRARLEQTLATLIARFPADRSEAAAASPAASSPLRALTRSIAAAHSDRAADDAWPELPELEQVRGLWSTLRTRSQVRRSLAQAPSGAGPLNSAALAHRALTLMGAVSPGYLQHFLAYVDTLSWLETAQDAGMLPGREPAPAAGVRARGKPRVRKRG